MHSCVANLTVDQQHPCFADHFPSGTVVPGAVLLEWVVQALYRMCPASELSGISSFKFLQPVLPGDLLQLHFELSDDATSVRVECLRVKQAASDMVAKGKLMLRVKT